METAFLFSKQLWHQADPSLRRDDSRIVLDDDSPIIAGHSDRSEAEWRNLQGI